MNKKLHSLIIVFVFLSGTCVSLGAEDNPGLLQAYPNPFINELSITFSIEEEAELRLGVYNLLGQQLRQISKGSHVTGDYRFTWDGKDRSGKSVPTGMYYVIFVKGEEKQVLKILKSR